MKFVHNFYKLVIFFTKIIWIIVGEGDFGEVELGYLSNELSPVECGKLLETISAKSPLSDDAYLQSNARVSLNNESTLRRQLETPFSNRDNCYDKLQDWSRNLPEKRHQWARAAMETELQNLGRPDLAKYVKKSRRFVRYFDDFSKNSKNAAMQSNSDAQKAKKKVHFVKPMDVMKKPHKATALQYYPFGSMNPAKAHANFASRESADVHHDIHKPESEDTSTKWTAFLVLLGVIVLTILSTVIFALYKKNRATFCTRDKKSTGDRCALADRCRPSHCVVDVDGNDDDDDGDDKDNPVRCPRRKDSESSSEESSRSPLAMSYCVGGKTSPTRKPKTNKTKFQRNEISEKSMKHGCSKKCTGIKHRATKCTVKQTKTRDSKATEKTKNAANHRAKPRLELKTFQEKIASILRKDNPPCKCCKCTFNSAKTSLPIKCFSAKIKDVVCQDENCQKTRMKNITDLCFPPDTSSLSDECNETEKKKIKRKKKKKKKKPRKDKEGDRDSSKEKEFCKSSARNSARSRDKNLCRIKKKPTKDKKERYNVEEACTRKTCAYTQPNGEGASNFH